MIILVFRPYFKRSLNRLCVQTSIISKNSSQISWSKIVDKYVMGHVNILVKRNSLVSVLVPDTNQTFHQLFNLGCAKRKKRYAIPLRWLKVAILKLPLPLLLLQTAIMEICAILKAQTDAAADSSKTCRFL